MIKFTLENVDPGYNYVRVYYTRTTSDIDGIRVSKNHLIDQKYIVKIPLVLLLLLGMSLQLKLVITI